MFNFNEDAVRKEHENGLSIIGQTQEVVDQILQKWIQEYFLYWNWRNYPLRRTDESYCKGSRFNYSVNS